MGWVEAAASEAARSSASTSTSSASWEEPLPPPLRLLPPALRCGLEELLHLVECMVVLEAGELSCKEIERAVQTLVRA